MAINPAAIMMAQRHVGTIISTWTSFEASCVLCYASASSPFF